MKRSTNTWWLAFAGCAVFVLVAMTGISVLVLQMEHSEYEMRARTDRNAELRAVLWDMESWLIVHLGRESSRPHDEYESYFPTDNVYTQYFSKIAPGDVYAPSPLLTFDSEYFPIHFQIFSSGAVTSPQVPSGNELDLAQATLLPEGWISRKAGELNHVSEMITYEYAAALCVDIAKPALDQGAQQRVSSQQDDGPDNSSEWRQQIEQIDSQTVQQVRSQQGFERRANARDRAEQVLDKSSYANIAFDSVQITDTEIADRVEISSFLPIWIDRRQNGNIDDQSLELIFLREVTIGGEVVYQGFRCDWPRIREVLIAQVRAQFPALEIVAARRDQNDPRPAEESAAEMFRLASIPAIVEGHAVADVGPGLFTPARATLGIAWLFVVLAIGTAGLTLRSTIDVARRRSRFASAVTHELRTPLTTFQMYSEMLADGMVQEPEQRQVYYNTLREESTRLSGIVENVLAYARLEQGHTARRVERTTLGQLFAGFAPAWQRSAEKCNATLTLDLDQIADREITIDVESLDQILTNLIDNACKYGCAQPVADNNERPVISVTAGIEHSRIRIEVRDQGPGIEPSVENSIFEPFERGLIEPGSTSPGVGLGLALSRELATGMGGSLTYCRPLDGAGTCFVVMFPIIG